MGLCEAAEFDSNSSLSKLDGWIQRIIGLETIRCFYLSSDWESGMLSAWIEVAWCLNSYVRRGWSSLLRRIPNSHDNKNFGGKCWPKILLLNSVPKSQGNTISITAVLVPDLDRMKSATGFLFGGSSSSISEIAFQRGKYWNSGWPRLDMNRQVITYNRWKRWNNQL